MKKLVTLFLSALLIFSTLTMFACGQDPSSVTLVGLSDGTMVTPAAEYDYFVVPEPAATTKVNMTQGKLAIAGDLQALYGDGEGYPQAVLVAKKSVIENNGAVVSALVNSFNENKAWLQDENTTAETIVNAVRSGFNSSDMTPTFTANNLSKTVINNCGINFSLSTDAKSAVIDYLAKINALSNNAFGAPVDEFFASVTETSTNGATLSLYCPDGAPALSVARLLNDSSLIPNLDIKVVMANTIQTFVTGATPTADICIMPVNAASKFLGSASVYQMLGMVTNGNIYILKKEGGEDITKDNIRSVLNGKKIGVMNLANVPGLTLKAILNDAEIEFSEPA